LIYYIPETANDSEAKSQLQSVPCPVHLAGVFFYNFDPSDCKRAVKEQALYYNEGATWSNDDESNQLMALVVLGDIPTVVCKIFVPCGHLTVQPLTANIDHWQDTRKQCRSLSAI
jgi:hypothetical protein